MNYLQLAKTSEIDDESTHLYGSSQNKSSFPDYTESAYLILLVDQDGHNKLLYAPSFHDVSSGHTGGQFDAICPYLPKRLPFSGVTIDDDLVQDTTRKIADMLFRNVESDAATVEWFPLTRKKSADEFLLFREYGSFEARAVKVRKLELHPDLDD